MEDNWYDTVVSAFDSERIFSVVDWASDSPLPLYLPMNMALPPLESDKKKEVDASYLVFPWGINDPEEGERVTVLESIAADKVASPYGWRSIPLPNVPSVMQNLAPFPFPDKDVIVNFTTTLGNNVFAQENWEGLNAYVDNYRPDAGSSLDFTYAYKPKDEDTKEGRMREAKHHINATVTQLFYTSNMFHDLLYRFVFQHVVSSVTYGCFTDTVSTKSLVISNNIISDVVDVRTMP